MGFIGDSGFSILRIETDCNAEKFTRKTLEHFWNLLRRYKGENNSLICLKDICKCLILNNLSRMDSNHDKVIQSHLRASAVTDGDAFGEMEGIIGVSKWNDWRVAELAMVNTNIFFIRGL